MESLSKINESRIFQSLDLSKRFLDLISRFGNQLGDEGVKVVPYTNSSILKLASLPEDKLNRLYNAFTSYYGALHSVHHEGGQIVDSKRTLWNICSKLGYRVRHDLMERITDGEVIEIYTADWVQIFRNMEFINLCTYDLTALFTYEFHELFERPDRINEQIFTLLNDVFQGKIRETIDLEFEPHVLKERFSSELASFFIEPGILSPLTDDSRQTVAFVTTLKARRIEN